MKFEQTHTFKEKRYLYSNVRVCDMATLRYAYQCPDIAVGYIFIFRGKGRRVIVSAICDKNFYVPGLAISIADHD